MKAVPLRCVSLVLLCLLPPPSLWADETFETKIRPLLVAKCQQCHGAKVQMAGISLATAEGFAKAQPKLWEALEYNGKVKMPPSGKLAESQLADLKAWLDRGAPWPKYEAPASAQSLLEAEKTHWAFLPLRPARLASIDAYVNEGLVAQKLRPAPLADKRTLLRRVAYDLTGLPPTPALQKSFMQDNSPDAYAKLVDQLLASPHYGERWGRNWLDVARFADSTGMDEDHLYPHAWRYRDYVVRAFNQDLPYHQFMKDQIAGDLYPERGKDGIVATGFLALGPKPLAQQDRIKMIYDVVDEQIDTVSKAFLGLTVACARCHDHKFDPIPTRDYYGLAGIFASTKQFRALGRPGAVSFVHYTPLDPDAHGRYQAHRWRIFAKQLELEEAYAEDLAREGSLHRPKLGEIKDAAWLEKHQLSNLSPEELQKRLETASLKWEEQLTNWRRRFASEVVVERDLPARPKPANPENPFLPGGPLEVKDSPRVAFLRAEFAQLQSTLPPEPEMACAVADGVTMSQHVFLRGDHLQPGPPVERHFPTILGGEATPKIAAGSGRRELAEWLANPTNPLPARVMVNRIWLGHFGEGLMRTPNNWGLTGDRPVHGELLDFLASEFIRNGWSMKKLHRQILLSDTYRRAATADNRDVDPANRWLSRFPRLRMSVEQIRDSLLHIDGTLDTTMGGKESAKPDALLRRTLYMTVKRGSVPALLSTFDYGDATTVSEGRPRTNVAPQALFLRNSAFVQTRAKNLAEKLMALPGTDAARVAELYSLVLTRPPTEVEIDEGLRYVAELEAKHSRQLAWQSYCQVLFATNEFLYLN